jgi:hypothetical protein
MKDPKAPDTTVPAADDAPRYDGLPDPGVCNRGNRSPEPKPGADFLGDWVLRTKEEES